MKKRTIGLVFLLGAFLIFSQAKAVQEPSAFPVILLSPLVVDAGPITNYQLIPQIFTVRNQGTALLYISKIKYT